MLTIVTRADWHKHFRYWKDCLTEEASCIEIHGHLVQGCKNEDGSYAFAIDSEKVTYDNVAALYDTLIRTRLDIPWLNEAELNEYAIWLSTNKPRNWKHTLNLVVAQLEDLCINSAV